MVQLEQLDDLLSLKLQDGGDTNMPMRRRIYMKARLSPVLYIFSSGMIYCCLSSERKLSSNQYLQKRR
jgi:hypothetical protein